MFRVLSGAYIAGIFLLADSPMVDEVAAFNPYSLLHIPLYGILTFLLILSFSGKQTKVVNSTDSINSKDPRNSSREMRSLFHWDSTNPSNPINSSNSSNLFIAGIIALVVAIADEIHQVYLPSRNASIIDVLLDIIGIILCIALISRVASKSRFINAIMLIGRRTQKKVYD